MDTAPREARENWQRGKLLRKHLGRERKLHRCHLMEELGEGTLEMRKENLRTPPVGMDGCSGKTHAEGSSIC